MPTTTASHVTATNKAMSESLSTQTESTANTQDGASLTSADPQGGAIQPGQAENQQNKDGFYLNYTLGGTLPQTAADYSYIITARWAFQIVRVTEKHEVAGTDAGAVTLDVLIVNDGSAISTGASVLKAPMSLKTAANTTQFFEKTTLSNARVIKPNQSIGLKTAGTLTSLAGVCVTLYCRPVNRGSYH